MSALLFDLRHAARTLMRTPVFTAVTILTLAIGIGSTSATFSLVNAALLRPLGFHDPDRLVIVWEGFPRAGADKVQAAPPDYLDLVRDQRSFTALAAHRCDTMELGGPGDPQRIDVARSSAELFPVLGVDPLIGRVFTRAEDTPGHDVVVLSHRLWQRVFAGRRSVVGETVRLDRRPVVVIGVMPASFVFPRRGLNFNSTPAEAWVPIAFSSVDRAERGCCFTNSIVARLKEGVEIDQARTEISRLSERIRQTYPPDFLNTPYQLEMSVAFLREEIAGQIRTPLLVLFASVALVLVVVCSNVANLVISRAAVQQREMAVRLALGATRARLLQYLLCESLMLSAAAGVLGLAGGIAMLSALPAFLATSLPGLTDVGLDPRIVTFTAGISISTAIACGIAPLYASDGDVGSRLRQSSGRTVVEGRGQLLQRALVVTTVALAVVLLMGAGLLVRSFAALLRTEPGFQPQRVLTMSVTLPRPAYRDPETVHRFARAAFGGMRTVPGVRAASISTDVPLESNERRSMVVDTGIVLETAPLVSTTWFYGDYFQTLGVPLVRGRIFTSEEQDRDREVAIVSASLANRYWHGQNPLGKRIKWGLSGSDGLPWKTIVGVVGDVSDGALRDAPKMHVYVPLRQVLPEIGDDSPLHIGRLLRIAVRAEQEPSGLAAAARRTVAAVDSALPVTSIATMERQLQESVAPQRFSTMVLSAFALCALLLAAIGLYGVLAFTVAQRTREIGVRIAIGASPNHVIRMVVREGMRLVIVGLTVGLGAAAAVTRMMASLLYRTDPYDPWTFIVSPLVLCAISLLACYVPARRAAHIEPLTALRTE